ncbi:hypothetical protein FB2170_10439 [Maribacter sp. HTCC2170]|nr:hypothetical protein FB2170_10439 [Maribacter sp. HTCC2170]
MVCAQGEVTDIGVLPSILSENSGLIFYGDKLITHNDSGNDPVLYEVDTLSLAITRTISITNVENVDWEDLTQDEQYIYIGDIGNNRGTRTDLAIYRISKQDFDQSDSVSAEIIAYNYEDQNDFGDQGNSDWDAEALFVLDGQLIVLTKQWQSLGTVAYAIPITPGTHTATRAGNYGINGLVTGASMNTETNELIVLGYSMILEPFIYRVIEPEVQDVFVSGGLKQDVSFGFGQTEGIAFVGSNRFLVSSESYTRDVPAINLSSKLFALQLPIIEVGIPEPEPEPEPEPKPEEENETYFAVYPDQRPNIMTYELRSEKKVLARAVYDITGKRVQFHVSSEFGESEINVTTLKTGIYHLVVYLGDTVESKPFFRK